METTNRVEVEGTIHFESTEGNHNQQESQEKKGEKRMPSAGIDLLTWTKKQKRQKGGSRQLPAFH
jgi:hypothetical protein